MIDDDEYPNGFIRCANCMRKMPNTIMAIPKCGRFDCQMMTKRRRLKNVK